MLWRPVGASPAQPDSLLNLTLLVPPCWWRSFLKTPTRKIVGCGPCNTGNALRCANTWQSVSSSHSLNNSSVEKTATGNCSRRPTSTRRCGCPALAARFLSERSSTTLPFHRPHRPLDDKTKCGHSPRAAAFALINHRSATSRRCNTKTARRAGRGSCRRRSAGRRPVFPARAAARLDPVAFRCGSAPRL